MASVTRKTIGRRGDSDTVPSFIGRPLYWLSYSGHQQLFLPGLLLENSCYRRITFHVSLLYFWCPGDKSWNLHFAALTDIIVLSFGVIFLFICFLFFLFILFQWKSKDFVSLSGLINNVIWRFSCGVVTFPLDVVLLLASSASHCRITNKKFRVGRKWRHCRERVKGV